MGTAQDLAGFWVHAVTVATRTGTGATGDVYSAPATVNGFWEPVVHLVRNAAGEQVTANNALYVAAADAAKFALDSKVTGPDGQLTRVIMTSALTSGTMDLPDHAEIHLT